MKINKEDLKLLADKDDASLWAEIFKMASEHGYSIRKEPPNHSDMEKIRGAMRGIDKINLKDAVRMMNTYKERQGNKDGRG